MPDYRYRAVTSAGRLMTGTIEAVDAAEAKASLSQIGLEPQELSPAPPRAPASPLGRSELLLFNQQLASMASSGVPLERGLRELSRDIRSPALRRAVEAIIADLESGQNLEQAFAARKTAFPPLYRHIVQAGIRSGRLGEMLTSLNQHLEVGLQTRRIIGEALAYPLMVLALALLIATGMMWVVVPQLRSLILEIEVNSRSRGPGLLIQTLFFTSDHLGLVWAVLGGVVVGGLVMRGLLRQSGGGRVFLEGLLFRVPVLGRLYLNCAMARLSDSLAVMVSGGCDLPSALRTAGGASGSERLSRDCDRLAAQVETGQGVGDEAVLSGEGNLPSLFLYSVQVGCQRGSLSDNCYALGQMYTSQARSLQSMLQTLLMPLMILVVGLLIGAVIYGLFSVMHRMLDALGGI